MISTDTSVTITAPVATHFAGQEISDQHLLNKCHPFYEMLSPIHSTDQQGMRTIKNTAAYLRNLEGQRRYSGNPVTPFVVTRVYLTGGVVIYHFYVQGTRTLAIHWIKADGRGISRRQSAIGG